MITNNLADIYLNVTIAYKILKTYYSYSCIKRKIEKKKHSYKRKKELQIKASKNSSEYTT